MAGCLLVFIIILIVALFKVGLWGIAVILMLAIGIAAYLVKGKEEKESNDYEKLINDIIKKNGIAVTKQFKEHVKKEIYLAVDESALQIVVAGKKKGSSLYDSRIISAKEIMGAEVTENGRAVSKSELGSTIGMSALGGLVFGGTGAIIGAIAGQSDSRIYNVSLVILIEDIQTPSISLDFLVDTKSVREGTARGSEMHTLALSRAHEWLGIINILMKRYRERN